MRADRTGEARRRRRHHGLALLETVRRTPSGRRGSRRLTETTGRDPSALHSVDTAGATVDEVVAELRRRRCLSLPPLHGRAPGALTTRCATFRDLKHEGPRALSPRRPLLQSSTRTDSRAETTGTGRRPAMDRACDRAARGDPPNRSEERTCRPSFAHQ